MVRKLDDSDTTTTTGHHHYHHHHKQKADDGSRPHPQITSAHTNTVPLGADFGRVYQLGLAGSASLDLVLAHTGSLDDRGINEPRLFFFRNATGKKGGSISNLKIGKCVFHEQHMSPARQSVGDLLTKLASHAVLPTMLREAYGGFSVLQNRMDMQCRVTNNASGKINYGIIFIIFISLSGRAAHTHRLPSVGRAARCVCPARARRLPGGGECGRAWGRPVGRQGHEAGQPAGQIVGARRCTAARQEGAVWVSSERVLEGKGSTAEAKRAAEKQEYLLSVWESLNHSN